MKWKVILLLLFLSACSDENQNRHPRFLKKPINYKPLLTKKITVEHVLPSINSQVFFLRFKDKPVSDVLDEVAETIRLPIYMDDNINQKSKDIRVTFVANSISLNHLLNWCARALDCSVIWLEGETYVYFGQGKPPINNERRFNHWPIHHYLSEFSNFGPVHVVNYSTNTTSMENNKKSMYKKLENNYKKLARIERIHSPFLDFIKMMIPENEHKTLPDMSENSSRFYDSDPILKTLLENLILDQSTIIKGYFDQVLDSLATAITPFDDDSFLNNVYKFNKPSTTFLNKLITTLKQKEKPFFDNFKTLDDNDRFIFYKIIVTEYYRANRQKQLVSTYLPLREFVVKSELGFKSAIEESRHISELNNLDIINFMQSSEEEALKILMVSKKLLGPYSDNDTFEIKGNQMLGRTNNWENHVINSYFYALENPEPLLINQIIKEGRQSVSKENRFFKKINCVANKSLDEVLYDWATATGISMGYVVDQLPMSGQVNINLNKGIQTLETSLNDLLNHLIDRGLDAPIMTPEDLNVLWVGNDLSWKYRAPFPYPPKVLLLPEKLRARYDPSFVASYLKTRLQNMPGIITAAANNRDLLIAVSEITEKNIKLILARATKEGKFPKNIK